MDAKWKGNEREVVPFDARKGTSYRKRNKVEGEFGEEAPKSGQKKGSQTDAGWKPNGCRVNAERIV